MMIRDSGLLFWATHV